MRRIPREEDRIVDRWLEGLRERITAKGDDDAVMLVAFVDRLLGQLVMDESRREATARVVEGQYPVTWECHGCGERRPDRFISIAHRKITGLAPRGSVVQINARYCNDRADCLRQIPDWLDRIAAPVLLEKGQRPANLDKPAIRVRHAYLQPYEPGRYKVLCPLCGGLLLVSRNQKTMQLSRHDRCVRCAQRFIYTDAAICNESLEPEDDGAVA